MYSYKFRRWNVGMKQYEFDIYLNDTTFHEKLFCFASQDAFTYVARLNGNRK